MKLLKVLTLIMATLAVTFGLKAENDAKETFTADVNKSEIKWNGKKVTGEHYGKIKLDNASLIMDNGQLTGGSFVVDMTSLTVEDIKDPGTNQKLTGHLKSDDFFGIEKFPRANFVITEVSKKDGDNYHVKGNITIKGKTEAIEFPAVIRTKGAEVDATATVTINRAKFDVKYGSGSFFDNLGDKMIYDNFDLDIHLVASKKSMNP
ncbi:MAG: YceI family protein [Cyclobacteriaceae bacterium]|nr:YceI family protein [Cyclobacteriaceae bacterium]